MEGYYVEKVDEIVVSSDQEALSKFQSVERWKQWGVNAEDSFGTVDDGTSDEGDKSCETLMDELEMDCRIGEEDESEMSDVRGEVYQGLRIGQDFQLHGFAWTNQTDENLVYSIVYVFIVFHIHIS